MAKAIALRTDHGADELRRLARASRDAAQTRRLLALAAIQDGASRTEAARIGGVGLQIVRDWVLRFNAEGPAGLVDRKAPGKPPQLTSEQRASLAQAVEAGPEPELHGVVRWRLVDLARWLRDEFGVSLSRQTLGRELRRMGFRKLSAPPAGSRAGPRGAGGVQKNLPAELAAIRARLPEGVAIELWWQDEARVGQKNGITRRWARRGTRPRAPHDQRTQWAYIFGAICPAKGKAAGLVMPYANTEAMQAHLAEISAAVDPGAHAVLILDQAGWHISTQLVVPENVTLLPLPPRSPELNPLENIWQYMRENWLSNRVFEGYDDIVAHCCDAWNRLVAEPARITSIGFRAWAHGF